MRQRLDSPLKSIMGKAPTPNKQPLDLPWNEQAQVSGNSSSKAGPSVLPQHKRPHILDFKLDNGKSKEELEEELEEESLSALTKGKGKQWYRSWKQCQVPATDDPVPPWPLHAIK